MALPTVPGQVGYVAYSYSSANKRALAKFTDKNHLETLTNSSAPAEYDRKIIDIYTQTTLESNDFLDLINKSEPYYAEKDTWTWKIRKPFEWPRLLDLPAASRNNAALGADKIPFDIIIDNNYFQVNDIITANLQFGDKLVVVKGPEPIGNGYLYSVILVGAHITPDSTVNLNLLEPGTHFEKVDNSVGEFDQELSGLPHMGDYITMYQGMSAGFGVKHGITKWADERYIGTNSKGEYEDIVLYDQYKMEQDGRISHLGSRWEPMIERLMKLEMLKIRKKRLLYGDGGEFQTLGHRGESKQVTEGILSQIRNYGNYMPINAGDFSINMLRDLFGALFYRRVAMKDRRVKLYTNEAGIRLFKQANKDDLFRSGITIIADSRFIEGSGQNMAVNYGFDTAITMETGRIEVSHLMELDLPQMNSEYGTERYSAPVFLAFDISNATGGTLKNIREVRKKGAPSMTWGYINGRQHHLGHAASKGFDAASMFPGYEIFMEDYADVFIEDLSRCVLIEQIDPRVFRA